MRKVAETLYLLATFNVRTGLIQKSLVYSELGTRLFPQNQKLTEIYAYGLILENKPDAAEAILTASQGMSKNLNLLRAKTAVLLNLPKTETQARIRAYLNS